jgi:hypothetical protein
MMPSSPKRAVPTYFMVFVSFRFVTLRPLSERSHS